MHTPKLRWAVAALCVASLASGAAFADQLVMKNGDVITGDIESIKEGQVFIKPAYADKFAVQMSEVVSIEADQTFEVELEDGSTVDAAFAHGESGMQTLVIEGVEKDVAMADVTMAVEPEPWYERNSKVELNVTLNSGNTDSQNGLFYADTDLRLGVHRHHGDLTIRREKTDGEYTQEQDLFNYSYDWMIAKPWYLGAVASWERNPINELDNRYTVGAHIGRDFFDDPHRFLTASLGAGYTKEEYFTEEDSGATGLWSLRYTQDFLSDKFAFFHNHRLNYQFFGDNNWLLRTNTGFRFDIVGSLYTNISLRWDYQAEPPEGVEKDDTTLAIGLGASF